MRFRLPPFRSIGKCASCGRVVGILNLKNSECRACRPDNSQADRSTKKIPQYEYRHSFGERFGPVPGEEIERLWKKGVIQKHTEIRNIKAVKWKCYPDYQTDGFEIFLDRHPTIMVILALFLITGFFLFLGGLVWLVFYGFNKLVDSGLPSASVNTIVGIVAGLFGVILIAAGSTIQDEDGDTGSAGCLMTAAGVILTFAVLSFLKGILGFIFP